MVDFAVPGRSDSDSSADSSAADVIERCFQTLSARLPAARWAGHEALIRWDISLDSVVCTYQMALGEDGCRTSVGVPTDHARAMVGITLADLITLADGQINLMDAFLGGRVRLSGDLGSVRMLQASLDEGEP
jgi:putative sterol carrier protein